MQAETLHVEFAHALVGDGLQPVVFRDVQRAARSVTHLAQRREVVAGLREVVLAAVGFGADQVLLGQPERLGHRDVEDQLAGEVAVAVVFHQHRPVQSVGVADRQPLLLAGEVTRIAQVGGVVQVQRRGGRHVVGIVVGEVLGEVQEHRSEGTAVGCLREADAPDDLVAQVVGPHVVEEGVVGVVFGFGVGQLEGVLLVVDQDARVFDGGIPVLHVEGHAGVQRLSGRRGDVLVAVGVLLLVETLLGLRQIVEHELIGVVQRRAADRLRRGVFGADDHAQLRLRGGGVVGLAVILEQLRIAERADGVDLAGVFFEVFEVVVADFVPHHFVDAFEEEVAAADDGVEVGVNAFEVEVGRTDVPAPEVAELVAVALDGIDEVGLNVGQQREPSAEKRAALEGGVDAREGLLGIREGLHGILFGDGGFGVFVQTRSGEEKHRKGGKSEFYIA